jgi:hypothetical protein
MKKGEKFKCLTPISMLEGCAILEISRKNPSGSFPGTIMAKNIMSSWAN